VRRIGNERKQKEKDENAYKAMKKT